MTAPINQSEPSDQVIKKVAQEAATAAVESVLIRLGIDVSNPLMVQKDMQALRIISGKMSDPEGAKDFAYLRELRTTAESIKSKTLATVVGILITGVLSAVFLGIKSIVQSNQ